MGSYCFIFKHVQPSQQEFSQQKLPSGHSGKKLVINTQTYCGVSDREATGTAIATQGKQDGLGVSLSIFSVLEVELLSMV